MTLNTLKQELRAGKKPEDLGGHYIGGGIARSAYAVGPFVVKTNDESGWNASLRYKQELLARYNENLRATQERNECSRWISTDGAFSCATNR
jgi:hypothetical protein